MWSGWWEEQYSDVLPDNIELLIGLEAGAAWERTYQDAFVPGLLQTPDYANAVISSAAPYLRSADIPRLTQLRTHDRYGSQPRTSDSPP